MVSVFNELLINPQFTALPNPKLISVRGICDIGYISIGKNLIYTSNINSSQCLNHFIENLNKLVEEGYDLNTLSDIFLMVRPLNLPDY